MLAIIYDVILHEEIACQSAKASSQLLRSKMIDDGRLDGSKGIREMEEGD